MTIDSELAEEYLGILEYFDNTLYSTVIIHKCMGPSCGKYRTTTKEYIKIHPALDEIYNTDPQYQISHGFCKPCADVYRKDNKLVK